MQHCGQMEFEMWGSGSESVESAHSWGKCKKNPGHKNFIPLQDFTENHLPDIPHRHLVFEYIATILAALTVRIRVGKVSSERPKEGYFSNTAQCCVGTGVIYNVKQIAGQCPCKSCFSDPGHKKNSWLFTIYTAQHVVYNDDEACSAKVDLFLDDENSRADGRMKTLPGIKVVDTYDQIDCCEFVCVTHDEDLARTVEDLLSQRVSLWHNIEQETKSTKSAVVIVSHPHGQPKHVTVGERKDEQEVGVSDWCYSYSTDTCPASSGARVLGVGDGYWGELGWGAHHCLGGGENGWNQGYW